jgi:hypothetical protein
MLAMQLTCSHPAPPPFPHRPQLYLNYKLKSVAHLPWRQMTYKFLNTIIDDLFAFVIKMPTLHRLSVFRDDIIFLIFIYQVRRARHGFHHTGPKGQGVSGAAEARSDGSLCRQRK